MRKMVDTLVSSAGLIVAIVLLAAGGLLLWGHFFVGNQVHNQLAAQKIFFPPKGSAAIAGAPFAAVRKYAGQQLTTGPQAEAYADHFIAVHLSEVAGGQTYSQVSAASQADPTNATLKTEAQTLFQGTTLRGLLLNAFAFSKIGQIAGWASVASFVAAGLLLILSALGFAHASRETGAGEQRQRPQKPAEEQRAEAA